MYNYWQQNDLFTGFKLLTIDTIKKFVSKESTKQVKKTFLNNILITTLLITVSQIVFIILIYY